MSTDIKIRPVKITLDKPRNLIFDLNAFEVLENIYENETVLDTDGNKIDAPLVKALTVFESSKKKIKHIKNFLYAGLVYEDDTLTPAIVGTMVGYTELATLTNKIWEAIAQALPEKKEGSEDNTGEI